MKATITIVLLWFSLVPAVTMADCFDAFRKCRNECSAEGCEDCCKAGQRKCEGEQILSEGCYAFKRKCKSECGYLPPADQDTCEDACQAGYRRCE